MNNQKAFKSFIDNHFFSDNGRFYTFCPKKIALSPKILNLLQSRRFHIGTHQNIIIMLEIKIMQVDNSGNNPKQGGARLYVQYISESLTKQDLIKHYENMPMQ